MLKSQYLQKVYASVSKRYNDQPEFMQAVEEFFESMDSLVEKEPNIEKFAIMERIVEPERTIKFRVTWTDDSGKIQVNRAMRVQFNSAIGPYKGGIRFAPNVNESICKFLGFEQTFKNSLTGLPMGGAKGGADFDPAGKSDNEIMTFCQSFMSELYQHVGPNYDVPAGDFGVGAREIGYMFGFYKKIVNQWNGVFTSKGLASGGSLGRPEATGYGVCYFAQEMLKAYRNDTFKGKRIIISGAGKVGWMAAYKATELGAKVIAMSDFSGVIHDENGIDLDLLLKLSKTNSVVMDKYCQTHPDAIFNPDTKSIWNIKCDIAMPCATQNEIYLESAKALVANGCWMLVEGANMPTTLDATRYFIDHGILFAPGKASNAGGVAVSGLEMTQNAMHLGWTFEEVDAKLKEIMAGIFKKADDAAMKYTGTHNLVAGANIAGFLKVYQAMLEQGTL
ncbi:MAG: NADP-specific glutamate dehydrogenase [Candidatus Izemoplasmatales bacterium]